MWRSFAVWGLVVVSSGCIQDHLVPCGNTACPVGYGCDSERSVCIDLDGLSVPPASIDFTDVPCGTSATATLSIRNFGTSPIPYTIASTDQRAFMVTPSSGDFAVGSTDLTIKATAAADSVPASPSVADVFVSTSRTVKVPLQLTAFGAVIGSSVQQLDFGEGTVGVGDVRTVTFANSGNAPVDLVPALESSTSGFALQNSGTIHVPPGGTNTIDVAFVPQNLNMAATTLHVTPAPNSSVCQAAPAPIAVTGVATLDEILVDHLTLDFGDAPCGSKLVQLPLKLTNNLTSAQTLTSAISGPDAALFAPPTDSMVNANSSVTMQVGRVLVPQTTNVGTHTATLTIDAPDSMPRTTKVIALVQSISAPVLVVDMPCVDVPALPAHVGLIFSATITNTGNAIANVTLNPSTFASGAIHATISPSAFQIPPQGAVPLDISVTNTGNVGVSLIASIGTFVFATPTLCGPQAALAIGCSLP